MPLDNTATIEDLVAAVNAIEDELGIDPMGVYADIRVRLDIIEARINNPLAPSPTAEDPFLIGNSGVTISTGNGEPTENRVDGSLYLRRDGYDTHGIYIRLGGLWREVMSAGGGVGSFGGDLAAITDSTQSVIGIRGKSVSATAPTDKQILSYNSSGLAWEPTTSKIQILNIPFEAVSSTALLTDDQANADLLIIIGGSDGDSDIEFPSGFTKPDGYSITIVNGTPVGYNITDPNGNITKLNAWGIWEGSWEVVEGFASHTYTPVIANGTDSQIIRGDGSISSTVPAVALPTPAANTKGGVALPASSTGLFYKDDGSWASAGTSVVAAPSIDANHLHVYTCSDVSGVTLSDTGNDTHVNATLLGTSGVGYLLNSPRPFRYGTKGLRLIADPTNPQSNINPRGAQATVGSMVSATGAFTIECFGIIDEYQIATATVNMFVTIDDGTASNAMHFGVISTGLVFGGTVIGNVDRNTTVADRQPPQPIQFGVPAHWMAVYNPLDTTTFKVYRNGRVVADNNQNSTPMPPLSRITIGNRGALDAGVAGAIAQVRISNVARDIAYALEKSEIYFSI